MMTKEELIAAAKELHTATQEYMDTVYDEDRAMFSERQWAGLDSVEDSLNFFLDALDYYND
jgi:hypothetical protein